ncbi:MAG TPA: choice-of-anchor tandem repeat GloVer-containing protein [Bryobacteraceae bacterium]
MRSLLRIREIRDRRFVFFAVVTLVASQASPMAAQNLCGPFLKFNFSSTDPYPSGLISADSQGNVYGTAGGTIWKYSPTGGFSTLASFNSSTPTKLSGVVLDSAGNLWGTNAWGGVSCGANSNGCGFIYELTAAGALNTVYQFSGPDGATPGALVFDSQGNLWGLTSLGGTPFNVSQSEYGNGTIFKYTPSTGTFTNPLLFPAGGTSVAPSGRVTFDNNGNLYGAAGPGDGSLFELSSGGVLTTLFSFSGTNGSGPNGYLAFDGKSSLYGTTYEGGGGSGGSSFGYGSIFQYSLQSGTLTTLYAFNGNATTGELPVGGPTLDALGNLYGTTGNGGILNVDDGVAWEYSSSGGLSVLVAFNGSNGIFPYATLAFDSQGNLWGTTNQGGSIGYGTLYEFTPNSGSGCGPSVSSLTFTPASITNGGSTTGTITLSGPAPSGGSVVSLSSGYPYLDVPGTVTVPAGSTSATFTATAEAFINSTETLTITATLATSSAQGTLTEIPGVAVKSISFKPSSVTGGSSTTATVTLASAAPSGGNQVFVEVSQAIGGVPAPPVQGPVTVTVPAGATSLSFPFATLCTTTQDPPLPIFAQSGGADVSSDLTVKADSVCQSVSLTLNPPTVAAGLSSIGTVTLTIAAPSGGAVITLSSNSSSASVPSSVTVAAGSTTATFTVTTSSVTSNTVATITAMLGSLAGQAEVNITPALAVTTVTLNPISITGGSSSQGTLTLDGPAPSGGATVSLSSSVSSATVPSTVTVAAGSTTASFTVTTTPVSGTFAAAITATLGSSVAQAFLTITGGSAVSLSSLTLNPTSVTGGNSSTGTVTLSSAAPSAGSVVSLSSSNTAAATVPSGVTVSSGQTSANFTVNTNTVTANTTAVITATLGSSSAQASLTIAPAGSVTLSSLTLNPTSVSGRNNSAGMVTLSAAAPSGGATVTLTSSNTSVATVPSSVTVSAGQTNASFTVRTQRVQSNTNVTISGTYAGGTQSATLTVTSGGH